MINYMYELYCNIIGYIEDDNNKVIKREYMWAK